MNAIRQAFLLERSKPRVIRLGHGEAVANNLFLLGALLLFFLRRTRYNHFVCTLSRRCPLCGRCSSISLLRARLARSASFCGLSLLGRSRRASRFWKMKGLLGRRFRFRSSYGFGFRRRHGIPISELYKQYIPLFYFVARLAGKELRLKYT